jgi:hypothetical protein
MSTRQNKKRKGRGNAINRERTFTTLTEGSEGSFMAAEEIHPSNLSHPFSVASSVSDTTNISPGFPMTPSFASFGYPYLQSVTGANPGPLFNQSQSPASIFPSHPLPPGQNDLEILERLKETIKAGQHEFFQPIPRPDLLANIYLGPHGVPQVSPHPEQVPQDSRSFLSRNEHDARRASPGRHVNGDGLSGMRKHDLSSSVGIRSVT